jgi:hypothetical protein
VLLPVLPTPQDQASYVIHHLLSVATGAASAAPHGLPVSGIAGSPALPCSLASTVAAADFSEVAVLFQRRASGRMLQKALRGCGIPFNKRGTAPHQLGCVRDVMACLTLVAANHADAERAAAAGVGAAEDAGADIAAGNSAERGGSEMKGADLPERSAADAGATGRPRRRGSRWHCVRPHPVAMSRLRCLRAFLEREGKLKVAAGGIATEVRHKQTFKYLPCRNATFGIVTKVMNRDWQRCCIRCRRP